MKKNMFGFLIVLMIASMVLAACTSPSTVIPAPETTEVVDETLAATAEPESIEQVEISFWHNYNTDSAEITTLEDDLIPAFEAAHPNIKVMSVQVPWPDFLTKLTSALAAGTAPDLMRSDIIWVPQLAEMGAFVALDEAMPDFADYSSIVFPGPLSTNLWKGHYYGLPLDTNTKVWMYNDEMYTAAGIDGAPATLADVEADCQTLKTTYPDAYFYVKDNTN
ncbi:MAG: extracellular solute-binding protein, partial [Anaerolineaceae bacterium]